MSNRKLKLLAWMDSPKSITGFGIVAKNILNRIYATGRFDVACVGINYIEEHHEKMWEDQSEIPYKVLIGKDLQRQGNTLIEGDPMGRRKTIEMIRNGDCDVFFMMRDLWDMVVPQWQGQPHLSSYFPLHIQIAKESGRNFRTLAHFPMEHQIQPNWRPILDQIDYGYCFTSGGMQWLNEWQRNIKYAPQGADTSIFHRLPKKGWGRATIYKDIGNGQMLQMEDDIVDAEDFRARKMRLNDPNAFVVLNVNRNQPRKDIRATMKSFKKFKDMIAHECPGGRRPVLWLQMRPDDSFGDARKLAEEEGLIIDYDIQFPPYFNVGVGWTDKELNMLYNACDVFMSTSVAEGFGLTPVEAGCAGCVVLVPGHSGHLDTVHHLGMPYVNTAPPEVRENIAQTPIHPTDTQDMARRLLAHYQDPKILENKVKENYKGFRTRFSWDEIFKKYWEPCLQTIEKDLFETPLRREANKDRILFTCEEAFGDILGASKAISGLKKKYPDKSIDFLCKKRFKDVLTGHPDIDRILDWDLNKIFDYKQMYYPHAKIRHGGWAIGHTHLLDMQAEMVGVQAEKDVFIAEEEFDLLLDDVLNCDISEETLPIVTINTTSQGGKMIDTGKWEVLIYNLAIRYPWLRFVLVGGPDDLPLNGAIDMRFQPGEDAVLSYRRMAWLQSKALCHLGIDSGPAHSADAVGTPSIIFWGWTNVTTCKPQNYSINIVPHYPTVCPKMGPCHGVSPSCNVNQYDRDSAMTAPCVKSLNPELAVKYLEKVFGELPDLDNVDLTDLKNKLKSKAAKRTHKPIYQLPSFEGAAQ